jgi:hypothetical protein
VVVEELRFEEVVVELEVIELLQEQAVVVGLPKAH